MAHRHKSPRDRAEAAVSSLLAFPADNLAEVRNRLGTVDLQHLRAAVLARIVDPDMSATDERGLVALADACELGAEAEGLAAIVRDRGLDVRNRRLALALLVQHAPDAVDPEVLAREPELLAALARQSVADLLYPLLEEPDLATELAAALASVPASQREAMFADVEAGRRSAMVPAWLAYGEALTLSESADLHHAIVAEIAAETRATEIDVWDDLLARELPEPTRAIVQAELMRSRTASLNRPDAGRRVPDGSSRATAAATAWLTACDGVGAYVMLLRVAVPDGAWHIANICLRVNGQVRDGFCLARRDEAEFEEIRAVFAEQEDMTFARVPLELAGDLAMAALAAGGDRDPVPDGEMTHWARCFVWLARSCTEASPLEESEPDTTSTDLTDDEIQHLFDEDDLDTWFLNPDDLAELDVPATKPADAGPGWFDAQLARVDNPGQRETLGRMFAHMDTYYRCLGKLVLARRCREAAAALADPDRGREILRAWLDYSFTVNTMNLEVGGATAVMDFGDPAGRQMIRQGCYPDLKHPTFRHLAVLDLTEAALAAAEPIVAQFSTERQPRLSALLPIAHVVARAWVDLVLMAPLDPDSPLAKRRIDRALNAMTKNTGLRRAEAIDLWDALVVHLQDFMDQVCSACPVWCFGRPTGNAAAYFHHPAHPAFREDFEGDG